MQAVTRGEVPSFPPQSEPNMIRDILEKTCRRCWTSDPNLRPTISDIVGDLTAEIRSFQDKDSPEHLIYNVEISNLEKAL